MNRLFEVRSMKIIDIPYLAEGLFAMSVLIFTVTIYLVLPALIFKKRTLFNPILINSLWLRTFKKLKSTLRNMLDFPQKKKLKQILIIPRTGRKMSSIKNE